jgi:hypothetical protein
MIAKKETAKEAWDAIMTMRVSDDHVKKVTSQQLRRKFDLTMFDDGATIEDYALCLSGMAAHLAMLSEEVKDDEIVAKMIRPLSPRFKQITIAIKTLLDVSTMSVANLTGQLNEAKGRSKKQCRHYSRMGNCTSPRRSGTHGGRSARWRTTPAAVQEAVALAKAVGAARVMGAVAFHQANPPVMSVGAAARWGIGSVSAAQSPRRSRHTSYKMRRRHRSCSRQQP